MVLQIFTSWSFSWKCITLLSLTSVLATATKLGLLVSLGILLQWHMPWWTPSRSAGNVDGKCVQSNFMFFSPDGKVLCDLIAIYSHSVQLNTCVELDKYSKENIFRYTWFTGAGFPPLVLRWIPSGGHSREDPGSFLFAFLVGIHRDTKYIK